ncbi:hypothetical protein [Sapientia aquatica]|uniref:Uncharacterized protein n=1 Tax=Sapientia aquatica TaxID=1549640 RepID=A0A4R5W229_9BURK|nr:hypothetical protein [Sapientia aquatica]TDK66382.1 hypothetical protein E2I14_07870 [Sapientia aquatica]
MKILIGLFSCALILGGYLFMEDSATPENGAPLGNECGEKSAIAMSQFHMTDSSTLVADKLKTLKSKYTIWKNGELVVFESIESIKGPFEILIDGHNDYGFFDPVSRREDIDLYFNELKLLTQCTCTVVLTGP